MSDVTKLYNDLSKELDIIKKQCLSAAIEGAAQDAKIKRALLEVYERHNFTREEAFQIVRDLFRNSGV